MSRVCTAVVLSILLLFNVHFSAEVTGDQVKRQQMEPMIIDGDADLISKASLHDWNGSGSEEDPVVIEELFIDAKGGTHCLKLMNLDHHFIVRNCILKGASDPIEKGVSLDLQSCRNGTLSLNRITESVWGIRAVDCSGLRATENWVYENSFDGIRMIASSDCRVDNNSIWQHPGGIGLWFQDSPGVSIENNELWKCYLGIHTEECPLSDVCGNSIDGLDMEIGISMESSPNSTIRLNEIYEADTCMVLDRMADSELSGNYIHEGGVPLHIMFTPRGALYDNFIYLNSAPLTLNYFSSSLECMGLRIWNNTLSRNNGAGIVFDKDRSQGSDPGSTVKFFDPVEDRGNHWTDLTSPDSDGDGIVDREYELIGDLNSDPYPLVSSPVELSPPPQDLKAEVRSGDIKVTWTWSEPLFDLETEGFRIYRTEHTKRGELISVISTSTAYYIDTEVSAGNSYSYSVLTMTEAGRGIKSEEVTVTYDDSPPIVRLIGPENEQAFNSSTVNIYWEVVEDETEIYRTEIELDDEIKLDPGTERSYLLEIDVPGVHRLSVTVWNSVNLSSSTNTIEFIYDPDSPHISLPDPGMVYTNQDQFILRWSMSDGTSEIEKVMIKQNRGHWNSIDSSVEQHTFLLEKEGLNNLEVMVVDSADNKASVTKEVVLDRQAPEAFILSPREGASINTTSLTVDVNVSDPGSGISRLWIRLDSSSSMELEASGQVTFRAVPDGRHQISVHVSDLAGNVKVERINIEIDTVSPYVVQYLPRGEQVPVDGVIWITMSESIDAGTIRLTMEGVEGEINISGPQVSFKPHENLEYAHFYTVTIEGSDRAGNPIRENSWNFSTTDIGFIIGKVVDARGFPVANQLVNMGGLVTQRTDGNGRFNISYSMGTYELNITRTGFTIFNTTVKIEPGRVTDLENIVLEAEKVENNNGDNRILINIAVTMLVAVLLIFLIILFFYRRYQEKHTISEEDREQMLEILKHFDVSMKIDKVDAYRTLGVGRNANKKKIRKAYRKLAAKYHPDRAMHDEDYDIDESHKRMGEINAAKSILLDDQKRDLQDRILRITGRY